MKRTFNLINNWFWALVVGIVLGLVLFALTSTGYLKAAPAPKSTICHHTGSQTNPTVSITVSQNAVAAHLKNHGDTLGACPNSSTPPVDVPDESTPDTRQTQPTNNTTSNPGPAEETVVTVGK